MNNNLREEFQNVETFIKCFQSRVENQYVIPFNQATIYQKYVVLAEMVKMIVSDD